MNSYYICFWDFDYKFEHTFLVNVSRYKQFRTFAKKGVSDGC